METNKLALHDAMSMLGSSSLPHADKSMNIDAASNYVWCAMTQTDIRWILN